MDRLRVCLFRNSRISYTDALKIQESLIESVKQGAVPSTVLLLQHNHVFSLGKRGSIDDVSMSAAELERSGAEIHFVNRGGAVTYHGPGQCVIYPIMDVRKIGARAFVDKLEKSIIATLGAWGIHSRSAGGKTAGVWVGPKKIAAIGVRFSRGVSMHGAALNVMLDTDWFKSIVPCGEPGTEVTTMSQILQRPVDMAAVQYQLSQQFMREHGFSHCESMSQHDLLEECKKSRVRE